MKRALQRGDAWLCDGRWPLRLSFVAALLGLALLAGLSVLAPMADALHEARVAEPALKEEYRARLRQAAELGPLREQTRPPAAAASQPTASAAAAMEVAGFAALVHGLGLRVDRLEVADRAVLQDQRWVRTAALRLAGSYAQLAELAEAVAASDRPYALRNLSWSAAPAAPEVVLEAELDLYRALDATERAALAKAKAGRR